MERDPDPGLTAAFILHASAFILSAAMPKPIPITELLATFPPIACRLLARKRTASGAVIALTDEEIAAGTGGLLTVPQVAALSRRLAWGDEPVPRILAFTKACGIDLESRDSRRHHLRYMNNIKGEPRYLRRSPLYKNTFAPLLNLWLGRR